MEKMKLQAARGSSRAIDFSSAITLAVVVCREIHCINEGRSLYLSYKPSAMKKVALSKYFVTTLLLFTQLLCASAQRTGLEADLLKIMKQHEAVGLAVAVVKDNG